MGDGSILAIDPGLDGAWALIVGGTPFACGDIPTSGEGKQRRVQGRLLGDVIGSLRPDRAIIEQVGARPGQGVSSMFRFGMAYGAAIAVCQTEGLPLTLVTPGVWKRHFSLIGKDKEASRQRALDLAPGLATQLKRKKDAGRAEAILIGLYLSALAGEGE